MKAVVYQEFGGSISLARVDHLSPQPDGAVIRVEATGLCRSDWHGWRGHDPDISSSRTCRATNSPARWWPWDTMHRRRSWAGA